MNIKFYVNNSPLFQKKADTSKTVSEIRELYKAKIPTDAVFLFPDGCEIDNEDESTYKISELISDGIIHMSSKSFVNDKIKQKMMKKSTPINGSNKEGLNNIVYSTINNIKGNNFYEMKGKHFRHNTASFDDRDIINIFNKNNLLDKSSKNIK